MRIQTKSSLGKKVWKIDQICTYIIHTKCTTCNGKGEIESVDHEHFTCPKCKGFRTGYCGRGQQFLNYFTEHTVHGIQVNVEDKSRMEFYKLNTAIHGSYDDADDVFLSKEEVVRVCRERNQREIAECNFPENTHEKKKMYPNHRL